MKYQSTSSLSVAKFTVGITHITIFKKKRRRRKKKMIVWKPYGYIKRALKNYGEHGQCIFREGKGKCKKERV